MTLLPILLPTLVGVVIFFIADNAASPTTENILSAKQTHEEATREATPLFGHGSEKEREISMDTLDEAEKQRVDLRLTLTCKGRCGDEKGLPCLCTAKCVLFDTCCENMTQDCPFDIEVGRAEFESYLNSTLICSHQHIYHISSCPVGRFSNQTASSLSDTSGAPDPKQAEEIRRFPESDSRFVPLSISEYVRATQYAPMTNSWTGLTFSNPFVHECNAEKGEGQLWKLSARFYGTYPEEFLSSIIVDTHNAYLPPSGVGQQALNSQVCIDDIISSCALSENEKRHTAFNSFNDTHLEKLCADFTGIVYSKKTYKHYRNRYCAYCHEDWHNGLALSTGGFVTPKTTPLDPIITFPQPGEIYIQQRDSRMNSNWKSARCQFKGEVGETSKDEDINNYFQDCTYVCNEEENYTLRPDGQCKARHKVYIVVGEDDFRPPLVEPFSELQTFGNFLSCGLDLSLRHGQWQHSEFHPPSIQFGKDLELDKSVYLLKMAIDTHGDPDYLPMRFMSENKDRQPEDDVSNTSVVGRYDTQNIYEIVTLVRAYLHFRYTYDNMTIQGDAQQNKTIVQPVHLRDLDHVFLYNKINITSEMLKMRGAVVSNQSPTTVCISHILREDVEFVPIVYCREDFEHENDEQDIMRRLNTHCAQALHQKLVRQDGRGLANLYCSSSKSLILVTFSLCLMCRIVD